MTPDPKPAPVKKEPDELDRIAATRIVSVIEWPLLDGSGRWACRVDFDRTMSPFEARGVLEAGLGYMDMLNECEWEEVEDGDDE